jgi:hypothetical protein
MNAERNWVLVEEGADDAKGRLMLLSWRYVGRDWHSKLSKTS